MTVDEAIFDLVLQEEMQRALSHDFHADAMLLGIEALKDIKKWRKGTFTMLLPGETEEELAHSSPT